jgi:hypothetical protein
VEDADAFAAVWCFDDAVARTLEEVAEEAADVGLVVDYEHL